MQLKMEEYVVCPNDSCNYLYRFNEAEKCKVCTATIFGEKCGEELGYDKRLAFAKHKWCPHKVYYFIPPSQWLRNMFQQAKFVKLFYSQKKVSSDSNVYHDVYDATIWKEFSSSPLNPSVPFLSDPNNVALLLNVDWFKPFKRSEYKVSAIMMTVLNLPREERFKEEWKMVLGVIPGPTEPKGNINTFLKPLVDDLILLWDGLPLHPDGRNIKAALLGISADMPAMKKVTQFLGHKADYGCSRCLFQAEREQSTRGASGNMSYLTSSMAPPRSREQVLAQCMEYKQAKPKSEALDIQKKNGVRYSELIRLSYFDIVRMSITDPMHTILLGLVHNEAKLCLSSLLNAKLSQFYSRIQRVKVPYDIGRIPSNINGKTDLTSLTADQWKNFALIMPALVYLDFCQLMHIRVYAFSVKL